MRRIEEKKSADVQSLVANIDAQEIITLNLTRVVQVAVDIASRIISETEAKAPSTMAESFDELAALDIIDSNIANRMKMAVGSRNIAIHNYQAIDWDIVFNICQNNMGDFREYVKLISNHMSS